jgi:AcrR family transcriptional regulator
MPTAPRGARRAPPPKRRDREVLNAAARVFYERGYADASVQDVADEVGILKGSLYHYIDSKEDLLYRLLAEVHDDVQGILDEVADMDGLLPIDRLAAYIRSSVVYNARNLPKISVYYHDVDRLGSMRRAEIIAKRQVHEQFVSGLIKESQDQGLITSTTDPRVLGNFVFANIIWMYRWYKPQGLITPDRLGELCAQFVINGVGGR